MDIDARKYADAVTAQRNSALDQVAVLSALVEMLQAENAELKKKIEVKEAK